MLSMIEVASRERSRAIIRAYCGTTKNASPCPGLSLFLRRFNMTSSVFNWISLKSARIALQIYRLVRWIIGKQHPGQFTLQPFN